MTAMGMEMNPKKTNSEIRDAQTLDARRVARMIEAEGLEQAPQAVAQMQAQERHRDDIKDRNGRDAESVDHVAVGVEFVIGSAADAKGELHQVIDDEGGDDGSAPVHGAGGVAGSGGLMTDVADGARFAF